MADIKISDWEDFFAAYDREGIKVIPNRGSNDNPKSLGYKGWEDETREYPRDNLLFEARQFKKWSALLGHNTKGGKPVVAVDVDLVKCLCENVVHVKNSDHTIECVQVARDFRKAHIPDWRLLETEISFTVHGGLAIFFKASDKNSVAQVVNPFLKNLDSRIFVEEIKSKGRQVVLPPSKIWMPEFQKFASYFWLDEKGPLYLQRDFHIRELR